MSLLSFLFGRKQRSASIAKKRLQTVLAGERNARNPRRPDYLPALQRELMGVVNKYVKIQPKDIRIHFERQRNTEVIRVKIELPQAVRT